MISIRKAAAVFAVGIGLLSAPRAQATVITSGSIVVDGGIGESLLCQLVNAGAKPLAAKAPATTITVRVVDDVGTDITDTNGCGATLAPGQACSAIASPASTAAGHCQITFAGLKANARGTLQRLSNDGAATLVAVPLQ